MVKNNPYEGENYSNLKFYSYFGVKDIPKLHGVVNCITYEGKNYSNLKFYTLILEAKISKTATNKGRKF
jgi:hypothetical protein